MANEQNLTQMGKRLSTEEAQRLAKRSAEVRREKSARIKTAREFAEAALNAEVKDKTTGKSVIVKDAIIQKLVAKAIQENDLPTVKYLFELIGDNPAQRMEITGKDGKDLNSPSLTKNEAKEFVRELGEEFGWNMTSNEQK